MFWSLDQIFRSTDSGPKTNQLEFEHPCTMEREAIYWQPFCRATKFCMVTHTWKESFQGVNYHIHLVGSLCGELLSCCRWYTSYRMDSSYNEWTELLNGTTVYSEYVANHNESAVRMPYRTHLYIGVYDAAHMSNGLCSSYFTSQASVGVFSHTARIFRVYSQAVSTLSEIKTTYIISALTAIFQVNLG